VTVAKTDESDKTFSFCYGAFDYVKTVLDGDSYNEKLKNLVKALYYYSVEAAKVFDETIES
jgi:hypothetical protein